MSQAEIRQDLSSAADKNPRDVPRGSDKKKRHTWNESEDCALLRQFLTEKESDKPTEMSEESWKHASEELNKIDVLVTWRSARDRFNKILNDFKKAKPNDEWKSGDRGQFGELERLFIEILMKREETVRLLKEGKAKKTAVEAKKGRADKKFMLAALHSRKKRNQLNAGGSKSVLSVDDEGGEAKLHEDMEFTPMAKRQRTGWQSSMSNFLEKTSKAEEEKTAIQKQTAKNEKARIELAMKREERAADEAKMQREQTQNILNMMAQMTATFAPIMAYAIKQIEK